MILPCFRLLCLALLVGVPGAFGALSPKAFNSETPPAPDGERFLFVVETSSSMEDLQAANEATVYDLIRQGVNGYIRTGDTYGLWTFSKDTHAGEFGMRVWESKKALQQATIAAAFLNQITYEKSANLKGMMDKLSKVIQVVSNLTVFVVSEGASPTFGTPFDKAIQADYRKLRSDRRDAKRPFVTTLIVRDGWFVDAKVTIGGSPIAMPQRVEPALAKAALAPTNAPPAPAATNAPPAPAATAAKRPAGSLLAVRDLETTNSVPASSSPASKPEASPPPRPKVIQIITKTNAPANKAIAAAAEPPPVAPGATIADRPPPAQTNNVAAVATTPVAPKSPPTDSLPAALVTTLASPAATPAPVAPAPTAVPLSSTQALQVSVPPTTTVIVSAQAPQSPVVVPQVPAVTPKGSVTASSPPRLASSVPPTFPAATNPVLPAAAPAAPVAAPTLLSSLLSPPPPLPVAAREPHSEPAGTASALAAPAPPVNLPAIEAVVTTPPQAGINWMLVYGALLLAATGLLVLVVARRVRSPHASIITQSMERR